MPVREASPYCDSARRPLASTYSVEKPLKKGTTPARSEPEFGAGGKDAKLPRGSGRKTDGGTGFNDATRTSCNGRPAEVSGGTVPVS